MPTTTNARPPKAKISSPAIREAARKLIEGGIPIKTVAAQTGMSVKAIESISSRNKWRSPRRVSKELGDKVLQQSEIAPRSLALSTELSLDNISKNPRNTGVSGPGGRPLPFPNIPQGEYKGSDQMLDEILGPIRNLREVQSNIPVFGENGRAATQAEMLPQTFEGGLQVMRDVDNLLKAEKMRGTAYRENISATLLKLSQYALALAETKPALALLVMKDIAKMDGLASKRFSLDDVGRDNKASDSLVQAAKVEELGGDAVLLE